MYSELKYHIDEQRKYPLSQLLEILGKAVSVISDNNQDIWSLSCSQWELVGKASCDIKANNSNGQNEQTRL